MQGRRLSSPEQFSGYWKFRVHVETMKLSLLWDEWTFSKSTISCNSTNKYTKYAGTIIYIISQITRNKHHAITTSTPTNSWNELRIFKKAQTGEFYWVKPRFHKKMWYLKLSRNKSVEQETKIGLPGCIAGVCLPEKTQHWFFGVCAPMSEHHHQSPSSFSIIIIIMRRLTTSAVVSTN